MTPTDHDPVVSGGATSADDLGDAGAGDRASDESATSDEFPRLPLRPGPGGVPGSASRDVRMAPPRLLWLDASRYLLLLAFAAVTGVGLWFVRQTLDGRTGAAGLLPLDLVDDADGARRAFVSAFTVGLALVPLRAAGVSDHARRAGVPDTHERRLMATFALAVAIAAIALVIDGDERGTVSLVLQVPAVVLAVWSMSAIAPIRRWFGLRTVALTAWAAGLPVLLVASWIGRLQRPVEATDSLQVMAFFAVIVAIVAGVIAVVLALSAADQDDAIRLSPELAVRADSLRR